MIEPMTEREVFNYHRSSMRIAQRIDQSCTATIDYFYVLAKEALWVWRLARAEARRLKCQ